MDKESVFEVLGKSENFNTAWNSDNERHYYFGGELAIDLDEENKVEFIELLYGIDGELQPMIYGVYAFREDADNLLELLREKNNGEIDHESDHSYGFLEISVGIYRESIPQDVIESIQEAKKGGTPWSDEDIAEEMRKASHWDTIGIGVKDYYR